jgi:3-oxoacid CoA-transferase subunit A
MAATRSTAIEAIAEIPDGATIMVGGFGLVGAPLTLIDALVEHSTATDLTIISNNTGEAGRGLGLLLRQGRIKKAIASFFTSNPEAVEAAMTGAIEYDLLPQGTLAERIRAGGAGIPAFFTKTGYGTIIAEGKETRTFDGEHYVMERGLVADISLVHAWKADHEGNLVYRKTARNFNPMMATAGKITIAEVEHLVAPGEIDPDHIITPGVYVQRIVHTPEAVKHIEQRTTRPRETA